MARYRIGATEKVVFAPAIASLAAPTQAELNAGTVLTVAGTAVAAGLVEMANFESASQFIDVPDTASSFTAKIAGRKTAGDPTMTFYDDDASATIRTALAEGTSGYIVRMPYGQTTGKRADVFPVTVGSLNDAQLTSANEAAKFMVAVAITSTPNKVALVTA